MSVVARQKYKMLMDRLYDKTDAKELPWQSDIIDDDIVSTSIGDRTIEVGDARNGSNEPIIRVVIRDANGRIVEQFDDENLLGLSTGRPQFQTYWPLMKDLLSMAQRQATGADKALDEIIDALTG